MGDYLTGTLEIHRPPGRGHFSRQRPCGLLCLRAPRRAPPARSIRTSQSWQDSEGIC